MKQQVSPAIVVVAIILILAVMGAVGYMVLGKSSDKAGDTRATDPRYQNYIKGTGSSAGRPAGGGGNPGGGSPTSGGPGPGSGGGTPGSGGAH